MLKIKSEKFQFFWSDRPEKWFEKLGSSRLGITEGQAAQRLLYTSQKKQQTTFKRDVLIFISQFKSPLILLLIGALILSLFIGETSDVFIIFIILLFSGLISFIQERNAGRVVEKLQKLISSKALVLRSGKEREIPVSEVVPGDVILFNAGDIVPADCLILEANELHANEAPLTGESYPVRKEAGVLARDIPLVMRTNCLWEGTSIVSGDATAIALNTGQNTLFGEIVKNADTDIETAFEKGLKEFGFMLMRITLMLSVLILFINFFNHKSLIESALFALALAVGMAPELLPAITTIGMSAGAKGLLKKKVIVKKLNSVQNLGEINLLCTDKTGTITEGQICIDRIVDAWGKSDEFVQKMAYWNASLQAGYSNPIDKALREVKLDDASIPVKLGEVPYDFIRKRLSIAVDTGKEKWMISKGAFAQCLSICDRVELPDGKLESIEAYKEQLEARFSQFGNEGLRVIAICGKQILKGTVSKEDEKEMVFWGFIAMTDPLKSGVTDAIHQLQHLGIGLKIITGDNRVIAESIGRRLGIEDPIVMSGRDLHEISPQALARKLTNVHIFSEVEPMQKESLIRALCLNYRVAYLGDGINDVSAINAADVGITVDNAVDVAREAADCILLEKDLSVIAEGIREGRKTFANTLKYIYISTGSTFGNMISVAVASIFLPFLPMLPKQILLTNVLSDFPFLAIPTDHVDQEQLVRPGKWDMNVIRNYMIVFGVHSSFFDLLSFILMWFILGLRETSFQTGWFIESTLTELLIFFIIRTHFNFYKSRPAKWITLLNVSCLILTVALPYIPFAQDFGMVPLAASQLGLMLGIVVLYVITADILKVWFFHKWMRTKNIEI